MSTHAPSPFLNRMMFFSLLLLAVLALVSLLLAGRKITEPVGPVTPQAQPTVTFPAAPPASEAPARPKISARKTTPASAQCKEYTTTIYIDGQPQIKRGTACLQSNGIWKMVR